MRKLMVFVVAALSLSTLKAAEDAKSPFYVYEDAGSRFNHYCPSGWMGSYGDLHMNQRWDKNPGKGKFSIQIQYSAEKKQGDAWAGIYWVQPCQNWGDKKTKGFDFTGYKKLTFMARGEKGGEIIDKFFFGGISGAESYDTDQGQTDTIELTKEWKTYEIPLDKLDLSQIIGGFGFVINSDTNPDGGTFYIDEIAYRTEDSKQAQNP